MHHRFFTVNYCQNTMAIDYMFGTYQEYRARKDARDADRDKDVHN